MEVSFQKNFTVRDSEFARRCYEDFCTRRRSAKSMRKLRSLLGFSSHNSVEAQDRTC
ncbi:hypothetical protein C1H46_043866 [Malus baccata]|uniref:Uncharacterized protein n=1 Tax=Malus baccata TaxID=106549 RepID=A0A540K8R0_MALBA|nr:hypothetical protein C1H46_043866 [Malus baccata]